MEIGGLQKLTLIDCPGRLAATVFLIGCNFRCPFCYSSELVLPEKIKNQPKISQKDFFKFLKEKEGVLEAVTICGGEPCINKDLPQFCKKIKKFGYLVKLDTNGSNPEMLEKLLNAHLVDYVAMDIKGPKEKYDFFSGLKVALKKIEKNIKLLKQRRIDFEFRTTIAPGLKKDDLLKIADWLSDENTKYFLQEFNSQKPVLNPEIFKLPVLKREKIELIINEIRPKFQTCQLR